MLAALPVVAAVRAGLTLIGFVRLHRLLRPVLAVRPVSDPAAPARVRRAVTTAARFIPGATCLTQALAAQLLLARAGQRAELRFGTRLVDGKLEAHAWLEEGEVVVFGARGEFAPLPPIEPLLR